MKTNNKKNVSVMKEVEDLATSLQEETKKTLKDLLAESVSQYMKEEILKEDDDEEDKDDATQEDNSDVEATDNEPTEDNADEEGEEEPETDEEGEDAPDFGSEDGDEEPDFGNEDGEEEPAEEDGDMDDEWSEFDDYKVGDNEYDFTGVKDASTVAKVFKLMNNDDKVSVKKDGDKISISDNEEGTEYVIELNPDSEEDNFESMTEENVNLGYLGNKYQKKDPIAGLKMDSEDDWGSEGAPKGTEKPYGKSLGDPKPFGKKVGMEEEKIFEVVLNDEDEISEEPNLKEGSMTNSSKTDRMMTKSNKSSVRKDHMPSVSKEVSVAGEFNPTLESIQKKLNSVLKENKELKSLVNKVKVALKESVQVNVNLGQIVKLISENTTTAEEKTEIVKEFNNAKTPEQAKALYESFSRTLSKATPATIVNEAAKTVEGASKINETKVYESKEASDVLDLMKRMENC